MDNKKSNIELVNLSSYTSPEILENKHKGYVEYGDDNDYFQFIIDRYLGSTTNKSIIDGIVRIISGKGLDAKDSNKKPMQYAQMRSIIKTKDLNNIIFDRKVLGMSALQVSYANGKVAKITHFPMNTLRPEIADELGNIKAWLYHPDWSNKRPGDEPTRIPAFGEGNMKGNEIYVIKPYVPGSFYFSPIDYQGALDYALLEEEIAEYLINDTLNGFSGTKIINLNNGVPEPEERRIMKNDIISKLTGARGEKVILSFNNDADSQTTVEDISLNDAPAHYEYLSNECQSKIIVGHRITSPLLVGIRTENNGLGSNKDEIETAYKLFTNTTIKPYQDEVVDVIAEILMLNDINLDLFITPVSPLDFDDVQDMLDAGVEEEEIEAETGVSTEDTNLQKLKKTLLSRLKSLFIQDNKEEIKEEEE